MAAYLIADIVVTDPEAYEDYRNRVPAVIAAHGGRYLARAGAVTVLEGTWTPRRRVIVEFPSMAALKGFYDGGDYRELRELRQRTSNGNIIAIEGI